jgi:tRNA(Ile)-lysidine synthase TilS/MesJ
VVFGDVMTCILCRKKAVIELQQGELCRDCFVRYFERKVNKTIRKHAMFTKDDVLCVGCSGGKDSLSALYLVNRLAKKRRQPVFVLGIDEGIPGFSANRLQRMQDFCKKHGIDCVIVSFKEEFGKTFDEDLRKGKKKANAMEACDLCRTQRMRILQKYSKSMGAGAIILGNNLDDEASSIMTAMFKGGAQSASGFGPVLKTEGKKGSVPLSKPLFYCTEKETKEYSRIMGFHSPVKRCPYRKGSYEEMVSRKLDSMEREFKGTKSGIIQNFMQIIPHLKPTS